MRSPYGSTSQGHRGCVRSNADVNHLYPLRCGTANLSGKCHVMLHSRSERPDFEKANSVNLCGGMLCGTSLTPQIGCGIISAIHEQSPLSMLELHCWSTNCKLPCQVPPSQGRLIFEQHLDEWFDTTAHSTNLSSQVILRPDATAYKLSTCPALSSAREVDTSPFLTGVAALNAASQSTDIYGYLDFGASQTIFSHHAMLTQPFDIQNVYQYHSIATDPEHPMVSSAHGIRSMCVECTINKHGVLIPFAGYVSKAIPVPFLISGVRALTELGLRPIYSDSNLATRVYLSNASGSVRIPLVVNKGVLCLHERTIDCDALLYRPEPRTIGEPLLPASQSICQKKQETFIFDTGCAPNVFRNSALIHEILDANPSTAFRGASAGEHGDVQSGPYGRRALKVQSVAEDVSAPVELELTGYSCSMFNLPYNLLSPVQLMASAGLYLKWTDGDNDIVYAHLVNESGSIKIPLYPRNGLLVMMETPDLHQDAKLMCVTLSAATATDARGTSICVGDYKLPLQWDLTIHSECALWVHRLMPGPDGLRRGKGEITRLCGIVPNGARFLNVGTVDGEPQRVQGTPGEGGWLLDHLDKRVLGNVVDSCCGDGVLATDLEEEGVPVHRNDICTNVTADSHLDIMQPGQLVSLLENTCATSIITSPFFASLDLQLPLLFAAMDSKIANLMHIIIHVPGHYLSNPTLYRRLWFRNLAQSNRTIILSVPQTPVNGMRSAFIVSARTADELTLLVLPGTRANGIAMVYGLIDNLTNVGMYLKQAALLKPGVLNLLERKLSEVVSKSALRFDTLVVGNGVNDKGTDSEYANRIKIGIDEFLCTDCNQNNVLIAVLPGPAQQALAHAAAMFAGVCVLAILVPDPDREDLREMRKHYCVTCIWENGGILSTDYEAQRVELWCLTRQGGHLRCGSNATLLHLRLGHAGIDAVKRTYRLCADAGVVLTGHDLSPTAHSRLIEFCDTCKITKSRASPIPTRATAYPKSVFDCSEGLPNNLVCQVDIIENIAPISARREAHFFVAVFLQGGFTIGMPTKNLTASACIAFLEHILATLDWYNNCALESGVRSSENLMKLRKVHSDNGPGLISSEFEGACTSRGIAFDRSRAYVKTDNNRVELRNRHIETMGRAMLHTYSSPACLWPFAYVQATVVFNLLSSKANVNDYAPLTATVGLPPNLERLRVWGAPTRIHLDPAQRGTDDLPILSKHLVHRAKIGIFVGQKSLIDRRWQVLVDGHCMLEGPGMEIIEHVPSVIRSLVTPRSGWVHAAQPSASIEDLNELLAAHKQSPCFQLVKPIKSVKLTAGTRVQVYWPVEKRWFRGIIDSVQDCVVKVRHSDGTTAYVDLDPPSGETAAQRAQRWRMRLGTESKDFTPKFEEVQTRHRPPMRETRILRASAVACDSGRDVLLALLLKHNSGIGWVLPTDPICSIKLEDAVEDPKMLFSAIKFYAEVSCDPAARAALFPFLAPCKCSSVDDSRSGKTHRKTKRDAFVIGYDAARRDGAAFTVIDSDGDILDVPDNAVSHLGIAPEDILFVAISAPSVASLECSYSASSTVVPACISASWTVADGPFSEECGNPVIDPTPRGVPAAISKPGRLGYMYREAIRREVTENICRDPTRAVPIKECDIKPGIPIEYSIFVFKWAVDHAASDPVGYIVFCLKARLCLLGYRMVFMAGWEYASSATTHWSSLRLLKQLSLGKNMVTKELDADSAFTVPPAHRIVHLPKGVTVEGCQSLEMWVELYGGKEGGAKFYAWIRGKIECRFTMLKRSDVDQCVWYVWTAELRFMVAVYVDNFYLTYLDEGPSAALAAEFIYALDQCLRERHSKLNDLGPIASILGCDFNHSPNGKEAVLSTARYLSDVGERFGLTNSKVRRSPWSSELKLMPADGPEECTDFPYRELLGCISYCADKARPDILVHVSMLAKFSLCHNAKHDEALLSLASYAYHTRDRGVRITPLEFGETIVIRYIADATLGGEKDHDGRSRHGHIVDLHGTGYCATAKHIPYITTDVTDSEAYAQVQGNLSATYLYNLCISIGLTVYPTIVGYGDNMGSLCFLQKAAFSRGSRHYALATLQLRCDVYSDALLLRWIAKDFNWADSFTKPLGPLLYERLTHAYMQNRLEDRTFIFPHFVTETSVALPSPSNGSVCDIVHLKISNFDHLHDWLVHHSSLVEIRFADLFSGTASISNHFMATTTRSFMCFTLDANSKFKADIQYCFLSWPFWKLPAHGLNFIWGGIPCCDYSMANTRGVRNLALADQLGNRLMLCFAHFKGCLFVAENPYDGSFAMRRRPYMSQLNGGHVYKCSYCRYGCDYRKNTMLFSNIVLTLLTCNHAKHATVAQGGPSNGVPGVGDTELLYAIPTALLQSVFEQADIL